MMPSAIFRILGALALCLSAAGCQSEGAEWSKHFKDVAPNPPSTAVEERIGDGPVEITLLLPRGSTGIYSDATRDVRDGAAFAAAELGTALIMVRVVDTSGGPARAKEAAEAAAARKSSLFLSYAGQAVTQAVAAIPSAQRPPIINLSQPVAAENVFNFAPDEVREAATAVQGADPAARKSLVVIAPDDFGADTQTRLTSLIKATGGQVQAVIHYPLTGKSPGKLSATDTESVKNAAAILILGGSASVQKVLTETRVLNPKAQILGTQSWPQSACSSTAASGAIIAAADQEGAALIADRYKRHKGRALTGNAARSYDSVAIGSGLVRAHGADALTPSALTNKTGFRGVTGVFRFSTTGSVEPMLGLYRVEGGKLVPLEKASPAF